MPLSTHQLSEIKVASFERRSALCAELSELVVEGDEQAIDALIARLGDSHPKVRLAAANALSVGPPDSVADLLLGTLKELPRPSRGGHRAVVVYALSLLPIEPVDGVRKALFAELDDRDSDVRFHAITALNRLSCAGDDFEAVVVRLLKDDDDEVAAVAATAAADLGLTGEVSVVLDRYKRATGFAKRNFALAAAFMGASQVSPALARSFSRGVDAMDAADALVSLGGSDAEAVFLKTVKSWLAHPVLKARAVVGLCELSHPQAETLLETCLKHRRPLVRRATIECMGHSGRSDFVARLVTILGDLHNPDATEAVAALSLIDSPEAKKALEEAAESQRQDVREEAKSLLSGAGFRT